jgi:hypothetical protein
MNQVKSVKNTHNGTKKRFRGGEETQEKPQVESGIPPADANEVDAIESPPADANEVDANEVDANEVHAIESPPADANESPPVDAIESPPVDEIESPPANEDQANANANANEVESNANEVESNANEVEVNANEVEVNTNEVESNTNTNTNTNEEQADANEEQADANEYQANTNEEQIADTGEGESAEIEAFRNRMGNPEAQQVYLYMNTNISTEENRDKTYKREGVLHFTDSASVGANQTAVMSLGSIIGTRGIETTTYDKLRNVALQKVGILLGENRRCYNTQIDFERNGETILVHIYGTVYSKKDATPLA